MLALSTFLASAASTSDLQNALLAVDMPLIDTLCLSGCSGLQLMMFPAFKKVMIKSNELGIVLTIMCNFNLVVERVSTVIDKARLLAVQSPHISDWLHALPISLCGLRLDNEAVRVAVGLRLCLELCQPHCYDWRSTPE